MATLTTHFMGLALNNPIIAGSCDLTSNMDSIKRIEQAGAGALVLKSLFEEQIQLERYKLEEDRHAGENLYSEMATIFPKMEHAGPKEHLMWVKKAKAAVRIPVIASLNAVNPTTWVEYARLLADQGVDALELNFFATPRDFDVDAARDRRGAARGGAGNQAGRQHTPGRQAQPLLLQSAALHLPARRGGRERPGALQPFLPARHQP